MLKRHCNFSCANIAYTHRRTNNICQLGCCSLEAMLCSLLFQETLEPPGSIQELFKLCLRLVKRMGVFWENNNPSLWCTFPSFESCQVLLCISLWNPLVFGAQHEEQWCCHFVCMSYRRHLPPPLQVIYCRLDLHSLHSFLHIEVVVRSQHRHRPAEE